MIILKILQKGIDAIAKALAWLLVKMGLWLSVIYVIAFFVICALTGTAFTSVQNLFWTLLVISAVLGLWLSLSLANKTKKKEGNDRAVANIPKVKKKNGKEDYEESRESYAGLIDKKVAQEPNFAPQTVYYTQPIQQIQPQPYYAAPQYVQPIVQPIIQQPIVQPVMPQPVYPSAPQYQQPSNDGTSIFTPYHQPQPAQPQPQQTQPMSARDILFSQPVQSQKPVTDDESGFLKYPRPNDMAGRPSDAISPLEEQTAPTENYGSQSRNDPYSQTQFSQPSYNQSQYPQQNYRDMQQQFPEKPKVYKTRTDPDVLIYEYSDRLDYYRQTASGLVFIHSSYKNRR